MIEEDLEDKETKKKLTAKEWAEIQALWGMGDVTIDELSKKFGVSSSKIANGLRDRGVRKGEDAVEIQEKVKEIVHQQTMDKVAEGVKRADETKDEHYNYSKTLSKLAFNLIAKQVRSGAPLGQVKEDIRVIKDAMAAIQMGRAERFAILGLDRDSNKNDVLDTLVIQEMTAEEVELMRARQKSESMEDFDIQEIETIVGSLNKDGST